jgi:Tfp pilus assembly protein PilO
MKANFCSFVVFGPGSPRVMKIHLSRRAIIILVMAFLLSFFAVVVMGYNFPPSISELNRGELENENLALKIEASNAVIGIQKLDAKLAELEEQSNRINDLVTTVGE